MRQTKLLWIENCLPISSRSARIIDTLERSGYFEVVVCAWDRMVEGDNVGWPENYRVFRRKSPPARLIRKTLNLPSYAAFVRNVVREVRPAVVGCSNWDMALLASMFGGGAPIVYDVGDIPDGRGVYNWVGRSAERIALSRVFGVTLASRFFLELYERTGLRRVVAENLPSVGHAMAEDHENAHPPRIAFVGNVRFEATLRPLLQAAQVVEYPVEVYGAGAALRVLEADFDLMESVRFHGRYKYEDLARIYSSIDIVWAVYPADDLNVKRAISNKFFESVLFRCPGVFASGTMLGDWVEREGIGFVVNGASVTDVADWLRAVRADPAVYSNIRRRLGKFRDDQSGQLTWESKEGVIVDLFREAAVATIEGPRSVRKTRPSSVTSDGEWISRRST